ncbi:hypothetical protein D3C83_251040 [compost metagenome]
MRSKPRPRPNPNGELAGRKKNDSGIGRKSNASPVRISSTVSYEVIEVAVTCSPS